VSEEEFEVEPLPDEEFEVEPVSEEELPVEVVGAAAAFSDVLAFSVDVLVALCTTTMLLAVLVAPCAAARCETTSVITPVASTALTRSAAFARARRRSAASRASWARVLVSRRPRSAPRALSRGASFWLPLRLDMGPVS
jgi:hypothetical protein